MDFSPCENPEQTNNEHPGERASRTRRDVYWEDINRGQKPQGGSRVAGKTKQKSHSIKHTNHDLCSITHFVSHGAPSTILFISGSSGGVRYSMQLL